MIPSNRRSIVAASSAQRSFCLPGERAEAGREADRSGEGGRSARRVPARAERAGLALRPPPARRPPPAARVGAPPSRPAAGRERAAADRRIPAQRSAGPACDRTSFAFGTKQVVRTSKSPQEKRFFQNNDQRPQQPPPTPGASRGQPNLGKGTERGKRTFPCGVEIGERGRRPDSCERPGDTSGVLCGSARRPAGFPDPSALRVPLVSKFPPSSASAREPSWPQPGLAETRRLRRDGAEPAGKCGEERKAWESRPDPALPARRALPRAASRAGPCRSGLAPRTVAAGRPCPASALRDTGPGLWMERSRCPVGRRGGG